METLHRVVEMRDGRMFIPDRACIEHPGLHEIVAAMPNYWRYCINRLGFVGPPEERES